MLFLGHYVLIFLENFNVIERWEIISSRKELFNRIIILLNFISLKRILLKLLSYKQIILRWKKRKFLYRSQNITQNSRFVQYNLFEVFRNNGVIIKLEKECMIIFWILLNLPQKTKLGLPIFYTRYFNISDYDSWFYNVWKFRFLILIEKSVIWPWKSLFIFYLKLLQLKYLWIDPFTLKINFFILCFDFKKIKSFFDWCFQTVLQYLSKAETL